MALRGTAILGLWHDIAPEMRDEYAEWHTREHLPERLALPGFLVGRRLVDREAKVWRYGTIYEGETLDAFRSPEYLARLNAPTAWSSALWPAFRDFVRVSCEIVARSGDCEGGAMMTVRLAFTEGGEPAFLEKAPALVEALFALPGVVAVGAAAARPEASSIRTKETEERGPMQVPGFDAALIVEGVGVPELKAISGRALDAILAPGNGVRDPETGVFEVSCTLAARPPR